MIEGKLKPLARASSSLAFIKRSCFTISRSLEDELFRIADVLSEGGCRAGRTGADSYFGSTMITFDLGRVARHWRGGLDAQDYQRLAWAAQGSVGMHIRALRIAYAEVVKRVSNRPLGTAQVEIKVRLNGEHLHLDVDLEVPLGVLSAVSNKR